MVIKSQELQAETKAELESEVEKIFIRKIHQRNFWACVFSGIPKVPVYHIPTLRVRWDLRFQHGVCLEYNPKFLVEQHKKHDKLLDFYINQP